MKCTLSGDGSKCERCTRKSLNCVFREHRRGRKVGTRFVAGWSPPLFLWRLDFANGMMRISKKPQVLPPSRVSSSLAVTADSTGSTVVQQRQSAAPGSRAVEAGSGWEAGNLQPSGLLNHAMTHGKFSLRNVLSTTERDSVEIPDETASIPADDPVRLGHVNLSIAESLFKKCVLWPIV